MPTPWDTIINLPLPFGNGQRIGDLFGIRPVFSHVSGTISWPREWWEPLPPTPDSVQNVIAVQAKKWVAGSPGMFTSEVLVRSARITNVVIDADTCRVDYSIIALPRESELFVDAKPKDQSKFNYPGNIGVHFTPVGGWVLTLTADQPSRSGIDFRGVSPVVH